MLRSLILTGADNGQPYNTSRPDIMDSGLYIRITAKTSGLSGGDDQRRITARRITPNREIKVLKHDEQLPGSWWEAMRSVTGLHQDRNQPEALIIFVPPNQVAVAQAILMGLYVDLGEPITGNVKPGERPLFPPYPYCT